MNPKEMLVALCWRLDHSVLADVQSKRLRALLSLPEERVPNVLGQVWSSQRGLLEIGIQGSGLFGGGADQIAPISATTDDGHRQRIGEHAPRGVVPTKLISRATADVDSTLMPEQQCHNRRFGGHHSAWG